MLLVGALLCMAICVRAGVAQEATASLDQLKVAYTFHFLELTRWEREGATIEFCVYSRSGLGEEMVNTLRGRKIRNMQINTRRIAQDDPNVDGCKAIFISQDSAAEVPMLLRRLQNSETLTISGVPDFVRLGGIIGFVVVGERLRFDINEGVAVRNRLKISARLLELAREVVP